MVSSRTRQFQICFPTANRTTFTRFPTITLMFENPANITECHVNPFLLSLMHQEQEDPKIGLENHPINLIVELFHG